jgi:replicative DNA helicase
MAKDLEVCVVALSQLNRGVEQRTERQPMMSDLRDSGNIEQDADQIMMLYRDDYYEDERQAESQLEVFITKNRDGEVGKLALHYDLDTQRIKGLEEI